MWVDKLDEQCVNCASDPQVPYDRTKAGDHCVVVNYDTKAGGHCATTLEHYTQFIDASSANTDMSSFMTQPTLTTFIGARNRRHDAMRRRLRNGCMSRDVVTSFSSERHDCDGANWWIVRSGASQQRHRLPRGLRLLLLL